MILVQHIALGLRNLLGLYVSPVTLLLFSSMLPYELLCLRCEFWALAFLGYSIMIRSLLNCNVVNADF